MKCITNRVFPIAIGLAISVHALPVKADTAHFFNGKTLDGRLINVVADVIELKPSLLKTRRFQRLNLLNRHDVVEMRNGEKYFGEIIYANGFSVEISTTSGLTSLNRLFVRNIILGLPTGPDIEIPSTNNPTGYNPPPPTIPYALNVNDGPPSYLAPTQMVPSAGDVLSSPYYNPLPNRLPLEQETPYVMFPPASTIPADQDAINTNDRIP